MSQANLPAQIDMSQLPATMLRPLAKPQALIALHAETVEFLKQVLVEGVDYGSIANERGKAGMFKAGAEKVAIGYGLRPEFEVIDKDIDHDRETKFLMTKWEFAKEKETPNWTELLAAGQLRERRSKKGGTYWQRAIIEQGTALGLYRYVVRCRLYAGDGREVGQGVGAASSLESKYIRAPRDSENTILKMAKKRAMVDAVLTAAGLSDRFTQDTEDIAANARARGDDHHADEQVIDAEFSEAGPDESWRDWTDGQLRTALGLDSQENGKKLKAELVKRETIAPRDLYVRAYESGARDFESLMAFVKSLAEKASYRDVIKKWSITDADWDEWKKAAKAKGLAGGEQLVAAYNTDGVRDLQDAFNWLNGTTAPVAATAPTEPAPKTEPYDPFAEDTAGEQQRWLMAVAESLNGSLWDREPTEPETSLVMGKAAAIGLGPLEITGLRQDVAEMIGAPDPDRCGIWLMLDQMLTAWPKDDVLRAAGIDAGLGKRTAPTNRSDNGGAS